MAKKKFEKLFTPISIGGVKLRNRLVKTASQTYLFESGRSGWATSRRPIMAPWQRAARV
jgi:2,4-dienoyl-CoA reductase-like NADH-dependent reductase (Old Yellow Enzyme family)